MNFVNVECPIPENPFLVVAVPARFSRLLRIIPNGHRWGCYVGNFYLLIQLPGSFIVR